MSEQMNEIIDRIVESPTKYAILKLFKENPYVMDNRLGLSLWVGKPEAALSNELVEMVEMGVIKRWGTEPGAIYAFTRDREMRREIEERWGEITRRVSANRLRLGQRQPLWPAEAAAEGSGEES